MKRLAMAKLPSLTILTEGTAFSHLKDWWSPPKCVEQMWSTGVYFTFYHDGDYHKKRYKILKSHERAVKLFWRLMVY